MEWGSLLTKIITIGAAASALLVLINIAKKSIKSVIKWFNGFSIALKNIDKKIDDQDIKFENIETKIDHINEQLKDHNKKILRLTICSKEIPMSERIKAGDEYVAIPANGEVKLRYEKLKEKYGDIIEKSKEVL
jgi:hypothetical protein